MVARTRIFDLVVNTECWIFTRTDAKPLEDLSKLTPTTSNPSGSGSKKREVTPQK
jgi:hypothetical protein